MVGRTVCLSLLFGAASLAGQQPTNNEEAAQRLWEQMITAKGGRERLLDVHAMLERVVSWRRSQNLKDGKSRIDTLYGLPDRYWQWDDAGIFGFHLTVGSFTDHIFYLRRYDQTYKDVEPENGAILRGLRLAQLVYLNESAWLKPKPTGVLTGKDLPHDVDIVQTMADGLRADFYLDRRTHLPTAIVDHYPGMVSNDPSGGYKYELGRYELIDGIHAPTVVDGVRHEVLFNPSYREDVFSTPAFAEEGPEGWKSDNAAAHKVLLGQRQVLPAPKWSFKVEPSSGAGIQQTFRLTVARSPGLDQVSKVGLNIGMGGAAWCYAKIDLRTRQVALENPGADQIRIPKHVVYEVTGAVGGSGTLENSDCLLDLSNTSISVDGAGIHATVPLTFKPAFAGTYRMSYDGWTDDNRWDSVGNVTAGVWTVPSSPGGPQGVDWTKPYAPKASPH